MICLQKRFVRIIREDTENFIFFLWFLWMAVYYTVRMFGLTPWYDELYTYFYFISRGPVYAAIHWPLPNNHVGYSVLSGFLDLFGSSVIGLRGISWLCALANLILLYRICRRGSAKGFAFVCVLFYSCMNLVNQLAVQGRGYTLAVCCYLTAIHMLQYIIDEEQEKPKKSLFIIFSLALTIGLYALPSSVYWVVPICLIGGLFLLLQKEIGKLWCLIISSGIAAWNTLVLYGVIWLAIGSNLLSKTEGGSYYGLGHVKIICTAPFTAMKTGMGYMLATPYIQSEERAGFLGKLWNWLIALLDYFYSGGGILLFCVIAGGVAGLCVWCLKHFRQVKRQQMFLFLYLAVTFVLLPIVLVIQCKLPYYRVFSYLGVPIALVLCMLLQRVTIWLKVVWKAGFVLSAVLVCIFAIVLLLSRDYNREYGMSEYYARDAYMQAEVQKKQNISVTDCYQTYILKFYWDMECESTQIEGTDCVLLHKEMKQPAQENFRWEFYYTYETIPWDYINQNMVLQYENEEYELYVRRDEYEK